MMTSKTLLTLALSSLLVFSGCQSESDKTPESPQNSKYEAKKTAEIMGDKTQKSEKKKMEAGDQPDPLSALLSIESTQKTYTLAEVAQHNTRSDCWTIVNKNIADVTSFFGKHPGGDDNLAKACGKDATAMFESVKKHDPRGYEKLKTFSVGTLAE